MVTMKHCQEVIRQVTDQSKSVPMTLTNCRGNSNGKICEEGRVSRESPQHIRPIHAHKRSGAPAVSPNFFAIL